MPKGIVAERDCVCRACGTTFRSTKAGKAAFYCRRPSCDEQRAIARGAISAEERAARSAARVAAAVAKAEAKADRQAAAERRGQERADRRAERERQQEARRIKAQEARDEAARTQEAQRLAPKYAKQRERAIRAADTAQALAKETAATRARLVELGVLQPHLERPTPIAPTHATPEPVVTFAPGKVGSLMEEVRHAITTHPGGAGRSRVHRQIVRLAHAKGIRDTRAIAIEAAVELLAWAAHLGHATNRSVTDAAEDIAA